MSLSAQSLNYPSSLQEYAVSEQEFLRLHPEYQVLCTGIVVFNSEGKLLLVQRAVDEKAYPNFWVSDNWCRTRHGSRFIQPPYLCCLCKAA